MALKRNKHASTSFAVIMVAFIITNLIMNHFHGSFWFKTIVGAVIIAVLTAAGLKLFIKENSHE